MGFHRLMHIMMTEVKRRHHSHSAHFSFNSSSHSVPDSSLGLGVWLVSSSSANILTPKVGVLCSSSNVNKNKLIYFVCVSKLLAHFCSINSLSGDSRLKHHASKNVSAINTRVVWQNIQRVLPFKRMFCKRVLENCSARDLLVQQWLDWSQQRNICDVVSDVEKWETGCLISVGLI